MKQFYIYIYNLINNYYIDIIFWNKKIFIRQNITSIKTINYSLLSDIFSKSLNLLEKFVLIIFKLPIIEFFILSAK